MPLESNILLNKNICLRAGDGGWWCEQLSFYELLGSVNVQPALSTLTFKQLLLFHWANFNQTSQECSWGNHYKNS